MKRLLTMLGMLITCIPFFGAPVKYTGCTPSDESTISSFDFTLSFDIEEALASVADGEWGLGYTGSVSNGRYVSLYEGTQDNGTEIATALTSNFSGKSEGFVVNGTSIDISFPVNLKPEVGKTYTLVIRNSFALFQVGKATPNSSTYLKFDTTPLVLTFTGGTASSAELLLQNISVQEDSQLEKLNEVLYTFNENISVLDNAKVYVLEGTENVFESSSISVSPDDSKVLSVKFPEDTELMNGHNYKLLLPAGTVALASNSAVVNKEVSVNIKGSSYKYFSVISVSPKDGDKGLFDSASIIYTIPDGTSLVLEGAYVDAYIQLYKNEISEANLFKTLYGTSIEANKGLRWSFSDISFEPSTEYILVREKGKGKLFKDGMSLPEWTNEETIIHFFTPSMEEAGYAPLELGKPTLPDGTVLNDGDTFSSLAYFDIAPPELRYEYDGKRVGFWDDDKDRTKGFLYDVTDQTPVLVKEFNVRVQTKETATEYYNALRFNVNSILYEGHDYRIEMPEGAFTIQYEALHNYIRTPAFAVTLKGATPTEINLIGTSIEEGAELSSLNDVIFNFNGDLTLNPESTARVYDYLANGNLNDWFTIPLTRSSYNNITSVSAHAANQSTGKPRTLQKGHEYKLTIPAGCVYVAATPEIANKETTLTIKGVEAPPVVTEPEYVTLKVSYMTPIGSGSAGEYDSADYTTAYSVYNAEFVKGKSISLAFDTDIWEVKHLVRFNGNATKGTDLYEFAENGTYTSSALNDNARFEIVLDYKGDIVFSNTTGVAELDKLDLRVFSDGDNIMVEGVEGGEQITVYSPTGIVIGTHEAAGQYDTVAIYAPKGQTYIVRIQRGTQTQAAKIMH